MIYKNWKSDLSKQKFDSAPFFYYIMNLFQNERQFYIALYCIFKRVSAILSLYILECVPIFCSNTFVFAFAQSESGSMEYSWIDVYSVFFFQVLQSSHLTLDWRLFFRLWSKKVLSKLVLMFTIA